MDRKPKARGPTKPKEPEKSQSERFIETAREIGVDESGADFERAAAKIMSSRVPPKNVKK